MRKFLIFALILFSVDLWAERLTIASYNLRNYLSTDRMVEGAYRQNYPKPEDEKKALFSVIKVANPDVLVVQEMGGAAYFEEFKTRLKLEGLELPYSAHMRATDTLRHLAVFSNRPFTPVFHNKVVFTVFGQRERSLRGMLEARFDEEGGSWSLFAVHLKSRISDDSRDPMASEFRTREAEALRDIIDARVDKGDLSDYLIVGDFNDAPRSRPLRRFLNKGQQVLSVMQTPVDSRGEKWTHRWEAEGVYSRIDYILASPTLQNRVVKDSPRIWDLPDAMAASDHRMISLELEMGAGSQ